MRVPPRPHVPDPLRDALPFLGRWAVDEGLLTVDQLRSRVWRRLLRGVYVHRDVPVTHELRVRAACVLLPRAVASGRSAAVVWGLNTAGVDDTVEVTVPRSSHPVRVPGVTCRRTDLPAGETCVLRHVPVTSAELTAVHLAGALPSDDAVAVVDRFVAARLVRLDDVRTLAEVVRGHGSARARRACALADGLAGSPQETKLRLLMGRAGLPRPVAQHVVRQGGEFVARVDFGWPDRKVAVEYDGLWHADPRQFAADRRRLNRLREAGWTVVFVTAADLRHPEALVARIAAALAAQVCAPGAVERREAPRRAHPSSRDASQSQPLRLKAR